MPHNRSHIAPARNAGAPSLSDGAPSSRLAAAVAASTGSPAKSRRAFMRTVASVASVSVLAPSIVSASLAEPAAPSLDPIFAAIERYERAFAEFNRLGALDEAGEVVDFGANTREVLASRLNLASTAPATLSGLAAYARFLDHQSSVVFGEGFFDDQVNDKAEPLAFFASLNRSLGSLLRISGEPRGDGDAELLRLGVQLDAAIATAETARRAAHAADDAGLDLAYDQALGDLDRLWKPISRLRATTVEGLAVKARLAQFHRHRSREEFCSDDHEIGGNICDDLAELSAVEKSAVNLARVGAGA
jgi:hypothetical protein